MWTSCSAQVISVYWESDSLLKKKYIKSFYTVDGKIEIIYQPNNGNGTSVVNQEANLVEIFGKVIVDEMSIY